MYDQKCDIVCAVPKNEGFSQHIKLNRLFQSKIFCSQLPPFYLAFWRAV